VTGAAIVLAVATVSSLLFATTVVSKAAPQTDRTQAEAIQTSVAWVHEHIPAGATVALGAEMAWQTSLQLMADYRLIQISDEAGLHVDAGTPLGVRSSQQEADGDWIALRASPTDVNTLYGSRARIIIGNIRSLAPRIWIVSEIVGAYPSALVEALNGAAGLSQATHWSWPYGTGRLETTIFFVNPDRIGFPDRTVVTQEALARIIAGLERDPPAGAAAAASLAARAVVIPNDATAATMLDGLRRLAAGAGHGGEPSPAGQ
jgi:hypothetical protein